MEEKKVIKISLWGFLLIIAVIVMCVMGYFIYDISLEKSAIEEKNSQLSQEIATLETTINTLQEKIDSISNIVDSDTNEEIKDTDSNKTSNTEEVKFTDEQIKTSLQNYMNLAGALAGSPRALLVKLGLMSSNEFGENADDNWMKTNIQFSNYEAAMLKYMSKEMYDKGAFSSFKITGIGSFQSRNGILYYFDGAGTGMNYEVTNVYLKENNIYIGEMYNIALNGDKEYLKAEFSIENSNGDCVISNFAWGN